MSTPDARVIPLRPREPLWRHVVGDALRRERTAQQRTLRDVAEAARISVPYLSELERGRKEASSEVLAAASRALGLALADLVDAAREHLAPAAPQQLASRREQQLASRREQHLAPRPAQPHEVVNLAA